MNMNTVFNFNMALFKFNVQHALEKSNLERQAHMKLKNTKQWQCNFAFKAPKVMSFDKMKPWAHTDNVNCKSKLEPLKCTMALKIFTMNTISTLR